MVSTDTRVDAVGIFWSVFAATWTLLLAGGMVFLYRQRKMPIVRIRGLPLSCAAIGLLHVYWIAVQLGYIYGHLVAPAIEYWIMGIYLPFGIALFHASNSRFLHVAKEQKKYAHLGGRKPPSRRPSPGTMSQWPLVVKFRRYDYTTRMLAIVFVGMAVQFVLTLVMFLVSRKFHPSFGIPGTEVTGTPAQQAREQGRGWEWWPSIFWQVFWAWIVAPVILWRSRHIRDTQGWRVQTIASCLASLPAAPMWIIALNVDAMAVVNQYFVPPQWICVSIMLLEIFTIFIPCWQVLRHQSLRQETLDLIAAWESGRNSNTGSGKSVLSGSTSAAQGSDGFMSWKQSGDAGAGGAPTDSAVAVGGLLTMSALEYALKRHPDPLQHFSALKDFSGENIAFLTAVSRWKRAMRADSVPRLSSEDNTRYSITLLVTPETRQRLHDQEREQFNQALRIYTDYVSRRDAEFSINISSRELRKMEGIFEEAAREVQAKRRASSSSPPVSAATPFDNWAGPRRPNSTSGGGNKNVTLAGVRRVESGSGEGAASAGVDPDSTSTIGDGAYYWGDIPSGFDETVFDDAESSVKYLVLTNTWPKFVKDRRASFDSSDSNESYDTLMDMVMRQTQTEEAQLA